MKKVINTLIVAGMIVFVCLSTSCKKEEDVKPLEKTPSEKMIGKWVVKSYEKKFFNDANVKVHEEGSLNTGIIYEFDGKQLTVTAFGLSVGIPYSFITENGKSYITFNSDEGFIKSLVEFSSDNKIHITDENINDNYKDENSGETIPAKSVTVQELERM